MARTFWAATLLASAVLAGAMVKAQETTPQTLMQRMEGMGPMMGMGMMGQGDKGGQMGSMMPMMQMMERMTKMMEACSEMMGISPSSAPQTKK